MERVALLHVLPAAKLSSVRLFEKQLLVWVLIFTVLLPFVTCVGSSHSFPASVEEDDEELQLENSVGNELNAGLGGLLRDDGKDEEVEKLQNYTLEYIACALVLVYVGVYFLGRAKNNSIATAWYEENRDVFEAQFAQLSCYADAENSTPMIYDSCDSFKFWASGRRFCTGVLVTLDLQKRQDLFSILLAQLDLSATRDTLLLEFPMVDEVMAPFVFALCRKREEKKFKKLHLDLV